MAFISSQRCPRSCDVDRSSYRPRRGVQVLRREAGMGLRVCHGGQPEVKISKKITDQFCFDQKVCGQNFKKNMIFYGLGFGINTFHALFRLRKWHF